MEGKQKKRIAILGSTGSIGTQAISVVEAFPEEFEITVLTAGSRADELIEQAGKLRPGLVVIIEPEKYLPVKDALKPLGITVKSGSDGLVEAATSPDVDMVLVALVGFSALDPTLAAIKAGKDIALATKEVLVVAGEYVMELARQHSVAILPVDSEHSAIYQCLEGEAREDVEKIYLTASGGPFLNYSPAEFRHITPAKALSHPNWDMGQKVTVDSASMMNKGLELIEARWLFQVDPSQLDVIVHPQSVIHSLVQFRDGVLKAQMGTPDMKMPILYALSFPGRLKTPWKRFDFLNYPQLTFESADPKKFRNLALAYEALRKSGNMPCILNAANEVVVDAFLKGTLDFIRMPDVIEKSMNTIPFIAHPDIHQLRECNHETRAFTESLI